MTTTLPDFLSPFQDAAAEYLAEKRVTDVEFSGPTYQIQVKDAETDKKVWAFIQLTPKYSIKDCFCSCQEEETVGCVHLATAYLYIFQNHAIPLHKRFQLSLWNVLCSLFASRQGYDPSCLKKISPSEYACNSLSGKKLFYIRGESAAGIKHLNQIIEERTAETEETSLKFSNLSPEELNLWHEGKPSAQLSYELSFWSDLAKWLMKMQDQGTHYTIRFDYSSNTLPNWIEIHFPELSVGFYLSEANLPSIIPALATVHSELKVRDPRDQKIASITYDKEEGCLYIKGKKNVSHSPPPKEHSRQGHELKGWVFYSGDGFYAKGEHSLLIQPVLRGEEVSQALDEYQETINEYLTNAVVAPEPILPSYQIYFDALWNLHIVTYLFEPGDLIHPYSKSFGDWVYLDEDGFYKIEGKRFEQIETVIPRPEVAEFISQYRSWLNSQTGFKTHLSNIESHLTYYIDDNGRLSFDTTIDLQETKEKPIDFANWLYIPGQGFYQKVNTHQTLPTRPGVSLSVEQIPLFIKMHREELAIIPGFFSKKNPITKMGLRITLDDNNIVHIVPEYERNADYQNVNLRFFDEYVYAPNEGFHQLPIDSKIPERFRHTVEIPPQDHEFFLTHELESLTPFAFSIDPRLVKPDAIHLVAENMEKVEQGSKLGSQGGWYSCKMSYHSPLGKVDTLQLWDAIHHKKRFAFSPAGLFDLNDPNFNWLKYIGRHRVDKRHKALLLSTLDILRLHAFETIELPSRRKSTYENVHQILKEITEFQVPEPPQPVGLQATLRHYQEKGVDWLWFLYHQYLSGLLCDDMGLGKTHQAMALIAASMHYNQKNNGPKRHYLIICPTSVIYHWQDKLHTYLPGVKVCTFYGSKRSFEDFHQRYDILLTSYGIWRLESAVLSQEPFEIAIFDEIQVAKNHHSLLHASLLQVKARMRLGLTGTPIENRLRELKSLFDIVLPTYMPSEQEFREFFVKPIEKEQDVGRRQLLSRFAKPFILRRKKGDVLDDLPEKTEDIAYCALLPEQLTLYQEVLQSSRKTIMQQLETREATIPYMHVFALLTRLKQICDHPAVFWQNAQEYKKYQSGKWQLFVELLNEARDSGQKVVVFSQYLTQLDIFELYLQEHKIGYASIRGATVKRGEEIKRFHEDPSCEIFLGSLQAAGLGIDLTPASVVIHYDRWWNAARENQATDRVHRIGQQRGVQVMKLVTRSTFEERINTMIEAKAELMENVVAPDDHNLLKLLNREDIIQLLQDVHLTSEDQTELLPESD